MSFLVYFQFAFQNLFVLDFLEVIGTSRLAQVDFYLVIKGRGVIYLICDYFHFLICLIHHHFAMVNAFISCIEIFFQENVLIALRQHVYQLL